MLHPDWLRVMRDGLEASLDRVAQLEAGAGSPGARRELAELAGLIAGASRRLTMLFPPDLNDVIRLVLGGRRCRTATCASLATAIRARHLWRCPSDGASPNAWQIELWVRSPDSRGAFSMNGGVVGLNGHAAHGHAADGERTSLTLPGVMPRC